MNLTYSLPFIILFSTFTTFAKTIQSDKTVIKVVTNTSQAGAVCKSSTGIAAFFPCESYFNQRVDLLTLSTSQKNYSDHLLNGLQARGGWGNANTFQIDFSIDVLNVDSSGGPQYSFNIADGWYDSDQFTTVPAPPTGSTLGFESSAGTQCDGGDCHYLVLDKTQRKLYEFYRATVSGTKLANAGDGGAVAWPFDKLWTESLRGDVCTSADAGGFSIGAMLFSADELKSGAIEHAIRFILPNDRIAHRTYVRPASHTTGGNGWAPAPTSDLTDSPLANSLLEPGLPYGTRLRLKSSYDISKLSASAQIVAKALKKYGMILADGGNILVTAQSDAGSRTKYADVGFNARSMSALKVSDFEVVPPITPKAFPASSPFQPEIIGPMIKVKFLDCVRSP